MKKKGFTLIELLAVIVVLAIIALIVTPVVSSIIDSSKKSANARSVEGHIKNIEYAIIQNAFNNSMDDLKNSDGEISDSAFRLSVTLPDNDKVYCEAITISDGLVTIATGCRESGWDKEFTYEKGIGAYVTGEARPITNPVNPTTPDPDPTPVVSGPGLYDANDNLLVSWDDLVNVYGLDIEKDYTSSNYNTDPSSAYSVFTTNNFSGKLVISDTVTTIGVLAFNDIEGLTDVVVGDGVTKISNSAFSKCINLKSVIIGKSVETIGYNFSHCPSIEHLEVDLENTKYESRNSNAILYNDGEYLAVGSAATIIPNTVTHIDGNAFEYVPIENITIPDSVKTIAPYAFVNSSLKSIVIPDTVTSIGALSFAGCDNLTSVTIGSGITSIPKNAFYSSGLTSITIPSNVNYISQEAFANNKNLTTVIISEGVTSIGESSFEGDSSLTTITIPSTMKKIQKNAFKGSSLTSATFTNTSGWYVSTKSSATSGTNVDVTNASTNASNLISTYKAYYWKNNS